MTMQTLARPSPTPVAADEWPATVPVDRDTTRGCSCLRRISDAERQIIDALDTMRESITRCEQALELVAEARRCAPIEHAHRRSSTNQPSDMAATPGYPNGLTPREADVLRLIGGGQTNRQIADALFISPRTIERHIANIYLKIDAHNRGEAIAWALRCRRDADPLSTAT